MISPWKSGFGNPRTMSCTGPIAIICPLCPASQAAAAEVTAGERPGDAGQRATPEVCGGGGLAHITRDGLVPAQNHSWWMIRPNRHAGQSCL
jgi:hypothetical protein